MLYTMNGYLRGMNILQVFQKTTFAINLSRINFLLPYIYRYLDKVASLLEFLLTMY